MITVYSDFPKEGKFQYKCEDFGIPAKLKTEMGIMMISEKEKDIWFVATEKAFGTVQYFNIVQSLEKKGYKISKKDRIDEALLQGLYEKISDKAKDDNPLEEDTKYIAYAEQMIADSLKEKVSDIHVEKRKRSASIRMRKHGELYEYRNVAPSYALKLCTVMYNVLAENKDIVFSERDYQSAAVNRIIDEQEVKLRYQALPVYPDGFDVVLRVLPIGSDDEGFTPLDKLGYSGSQIKTLLNIVSKPVGALVIAGTTGSGKSTTLKNLVMFINAASGYRKKIFTVEDPPEYKIPRVSQIPVVRLKGVDYTKKSPFEDPLVATMRGDPDIIMIGEVRDKFTGDGLKKAAQSGHQVLTTVHAASALGIADRFADFGLQPSVLGSPDLLSGLCYQRLVPEICPHCAVLFKELLSSAGAANESLEIAKRINVIAEFDKYKIKVKGPGCSKCKKSGIIGRTVCSEIISPDFELLDYFRREDPAGALKYWRGLSDDDLMSDNMTGKTALEHAISKMLRGVLSPYDVENAFGPIDNALNVVKRGNNRKKKGEEEEWKDFGS